VTELDRRAKRYYCAIMIGFDGTHNQGREAGPQGADVLDSAYAQEARAEDPAGPGGRVSGLRSERDREGRQAEAATGTSEASPEEIDDEVGTTRVRVYRDGALAYDYAGHDTWHARTWSTDVEDVYSVVPEALGLALVAAVKRPVSHLLTVADKFPLDNRVANV
jgi:hypothetical protein